MDGKGGRHRTREEKFPKSLLTGAYETVPARKDHVTLLPVPGDVKSSVGRWKETGHFVFSTT